MREYAIIIDSGPRLYQALVVRRGLQACQIGLRLNSAYTPTNLTRTASRFTGEKYSRGKLGISKAIEDLSVIIEKARERGVSVDA